MEGVIKRITEKLSKEKTLKIIVMIGIAGILLILLSDFIPKGNKHELSVEGKYSSEEYREYTEKKLTDILSHINGVGRVKIMVTVSSTEEYIYADEGRNQQSVDDKRNSITHESKYVIIDGQTGKKPLITKVMTPAIQGVVIVCEGADNPTVCENIYKTVSAALDIPTTKIYVAEIK